MTLKKTKTKRGGARPGSGRKSAFGTPERKPFAMDFTPEGRRILDRICRRTKLSRNNVIAHLVRIYLSNLGGWLQPIGPYLRKAQSVLSIRIPADEGALLREARARFGKSYSDIGEALVRLYGPTADYPHLDTGARKRGHHVRRQPPSHARRRSRTGPR